MKVNITNSAESKFWLDAILINLKEKNQHMPSVIHFEIAVDDPKRAINFYSSVFGWKIQKWDQGDYWLANTKKAGEAGIDGALMKREMAEQNIVNTIEVPSIDEFMIRITENGGMVMTPKMTIPGVGYTARCKDTEGNIFGILETEEASQPMS